MLMLNDTINQYDIEYNKVFKILSFFFPVEVSLNDVESRVLYCMIESCRSQFSPPNSGTWGFYIIIFSDELKLPLNNLNILKFLLVEMKCIMNHTDYLLDLEIIELKKKD